MLDGAVMLFDGVKGVEAQSETVWEQANKYQLPRICFVNKIDRPGASIERTANLIEKVLDTKALLINLPLEQESNFKSVVDLPTMKVRIRVINKGL